MVEAKLGPYTKCRMCRAICKAVNTIMFWRRGYRLSFTTYPIVTFWWHYEPGVYDNDPRGKLVRVGKKRTINRETVVAELIERHGQELLKYMAVREKAQKEWGVALVGHECDNNGPYAPYDPGASVNASGTGSTPALAVCAAILKLEKGATK